MHINAGDLASILESDLDANGWKRSLEPYPSMPPRQFAMMMLSRSLLKKFHNEVVSEDRNNKALDLFININKSCKEYIHDTTTKCTTAEAIAIGEAKEYLYSFCFPNDSQGGQLLTLRHIAEGIGVGSGANIGTKSTSFYGKTALGQMSASSSDLYGLLVQAIADDPTWSRCEKFREQAFGHNIVKGSRLSFVPKSTEISRTICTEPVLNMLLQKGIAFCLEKQLRRVYGIDLAKQPDKNRKLARIGSETGRFGTIDLSSASDSMSLTLVRNMFHPSVTRWLERTRCPTTILPDGSELTLHMVSSMGNAFTFPLQTLFFSALVLGAYKVHGIKPVYPKGDAVGNFAVFGDDIIVEHTAYNTVCRLLEICGFTVNKDKSFNTGLFRESCGHDYYSGHNVRGIYIKTLLHTGDCYSAINRLNRWSARHEVGLPNTIQYLQTKLRKLYVPYDEDDSAGIKVPRHMLKYVRLSKETGGIFYQYLSPVPFTLRMLVQEDRHDLRKIKRLSSLLGRYYYNNDGIMLSLLHGSIRGGRIALRTDVRKVTTKVRYSSRWDYIPPDPFERKGFGEDWKFFTWLNSL